MKTFFNILQSITNIKEKRYPGDPFTIFKEFNEYISCKEKSHVLVLMNNIYYKNRTSVKDNIFSKNAFSKIVCLKAILENSFYEQQLKEFIFDIFTKAQKHYFAFVRFVHIYKIKKHQYVVTNDLMMNVLDKHHKLTFILVENKTNFLFNINEIVTIIETAIGHSPNFFSEPLHPLNPYNNQPLSNATLYNIYFQMKQLGRIISSLFHFFFLENFVKNKFVEQYEPNIREFAIKKYVFNSPYNVLYSSVIFMLINNEYTNKLSIDNQFPKDVLVNIFRPFLFYDYISQYYIRTTTKMNMAKHLLYIKLQQFYKFNPAFGRKTVKIIKFNNHIIHKEYILNTKYISFYNIPFANTKIQVSETPLQTDNIPVTFFNNNIIDNASDISENIDDEDTNLISNDSDDESNMFEDMIDQENNLISDTNSDIDFQDEIDSLS